jgi:hypothetical protein
MGRRVPGAVALKIRGLRCVLVGVANPPAWAPGWLVTWNVITRNAKVQFTNSRGRIARLRTADVASPRSVLFRETEPEAHTRRVPLTTAETMRRKASAALLIAAVLTNPAFTAHAGSIK